jgi:hypothetical protein
VTTSAGVISTPKDTRWPHVREPHWLLSDTQWLPLPSAAAPPQKLCAATEGMVTAWTTLSDVTRANAQAPLL